MITDVGGYDPTEWTLRCSSCGKEIRCNHDELQKYIKGGQEWPRCCGEVMTLLGDDDQPLVKPAP